MKNKKIKLLALSAVLLLAGGAFVANHNSLQDETRVVEAAEGDTQNIAIRADGTRISPGTNQMFVYLEDTPSVTKDDIKVTIIEFDSETFNAGYRDTWLNHVCTIGDYVPTTGYLYIILPNGFPAGCDLKLTVNISFTLDGVNYSQDLKFVSDVYINESAVNLSAPTGAVLSSERVLTFNSVENATGYHVEYRSEDKETVIYEEDVTNGQTLSASLPNGTYYVFIRANGNKNDYLDSEYVEVTGTYVVEDTVALPIALDEEQTKISGAGVAIYFADKPAIELDDINVQLVSFYLPENPNTTNSITGKVEYIPSTGRFYFTLAAGYLASHNVECTFKVSYVYNGAYYEQEVSFVSNELVTDTVKAAINWQYDNDDEPTAVRFIGTIENVLLDNIESVDFVFALDGVERTVAVETLYKSISGLDGFGEEENKYYAVYILKGLDAKDDEGNYKYRGLPFSADIKVTLKDETVVTAKEAKSFTLKPAASAVNSIAIDGTKTKVEGAGVFVYLSDTPAITVDDINVEILSYTSNDHPGVATSVMASKPVKDRYITTTGEFYFKISAGVPDGCDAEMVVRISYTLDGAYYQQDITFVGNAYQG